VRQDVASQPGGATTKCHATHFVANMDDHSPAP